MKAAMLRLPHEHGSLDGAASGMSPRAYGPTLGDMAATVAPDAEHRADLRAMVSSQVIPRLRQALAARLQERAGVVIARGAATVLPDVEWLIQHLLRDDHGAIDARIEDARLGGTTLEHIYLHWLVPCALQLAEQLTQDLLGLAEATIAFCSLRGLLRRYEAAFCGENGGPVSGLRALIAAPADAIRDPELPLFGLLLTSQFFRRDGWDARMERDCRSAAFDEAVVSEWYDLVEILATSDRDLDAISSSIRLIRKGSPNRAVGVIACGAIFRDRPEFVRLVGADRCAIDPLTSLTQANHLIALGSTRRLLS